MAAAPALRRGRAAVAVAAVALYALLLQSIFGGLLAPGPQRATAAWSILCVHDGEGGPTRDRGDPESRRTHADCCTVACSGAGPGGGPAPSSFALTWPLLSPAALRWADLSGRRVTPSVAHPFRARAPPSA